MVFYLVMCILWFIVMIIQVIIALIAWLIWHIIRKVVESNCHQIGDKCFCDDTEDTPITGELRALVWYLEYRGLLGETGS